MGRRERREAAKAAKIEAASLPITDGAQDNVPEPSVHTEVAPEPATRQINGPFAKTHTRLGEFSTYISKLYRQNKLY